MSDEEEKAINEVLLSVIEAYSGYEDLQKISEEYKNTKIVLNLIEKQSKEIEDLENGDLTTVYLSGFYDGEKKLKDKIKAKIEELEKEITEDKKKNDNFWSDYSIYLDAQREGFQSLLEKE